MVTPMPDLFALRAFVIFIGYPRSGHSLVGALLTAHPDVVISHELDVLRRVRKGHSRQAIFEAVIDWDARFTAQGRVDFGFSYAVPGAWQGRARRLQILGDKKGGRSAWWLHDEPWLLDRLRETVALPVKVIHVTRSPWDNIATIARRGRPLPEATRWYLDNARAVEGIRPRFEADAWLDLRHEALVEDPRGALTQLAAFLGVEADGAWLGACAAAVRPSANRSRDRAAWTPELVAEIRGALPALPWVGAEDAQF